MNLQLALGTQGTFFVSKHLLGLIGGGVKRLKMTQRHHIHFLLSTTPCSYEQIHPMYFSFMINSK